MTNQAEIPEAKVIFQNGKWVVIACPYCGAKHHHTAGIGADGSEGHKDNPDHLGTRVAHCEAGFELREYRLVADPVERLLRVAARAASVTR
jgi:hypothetical protein